MKGRLPQPISPSLSYVHSSREHEKPGVLIDALGRVKSGERMTSRPTQQRHWHLNVVKLEAAEKFRR